MTLQTLNLTSTVWFVEINLYKSIELINNLLYIKKNLFSYQMSDGSYDFFPLNRAMALTKLDVDERDAKLDDIYGIVHRLLKERRTEVSEKLKKNVRLEQKKWEDEHKQKLEFSEEQTSRADLEGISIEVKRPK